MAGDLPGLVAILAVAAIATAIAAVPWLRAFAVPDATIVVGVAALLPVVAVAVVARGARQPPAISYSASLLALALFTLVISGLQPGAVGRGLTDVPTRVLTETLPIGGGRALLTVPVIVVWLTGAATAEILIRSTRRAAAPLVPVLGYVIAFAATSGAPGGDMWSGAALLAAVAAMALVGHAITSRPEPSPDAQLAARPAGRRPAAPLRRAGVGALLGAVVVAGVTFGIAHVARLAGRPAALDRRPAVTSSLVEDPVDAIGSLRDSNPKAPPRALFSVTTSRASTGYLGVADLGTYNGDTWSFDTTFRPSGGRVPSAPAGRPGAAGATGAPKVHQTYELLHPYGLPLVPMLDRPRQVSGLAVDADTATGMVVPARAPHYPSGYSVVSAAPNRTLADVPTTGAIDSGRSAADASPNLTLPTGTSGDLGVAVRFVAHLTAKRPEPTLGFIEAASVALRRDERRVDPAVDASSTATSASRGGTSLAEVIDAVVVGRKATPEQFATMLVMVARDVGIPARIVTGFRVESTPGRPGLRAGTTTVTNRQAWTWAEIPVTGLGWVVVDPTPTATASPATPPADKASSSPTTIAPRQANVAPRPGGKRTQSLAPSTHLPAPRHHASGLAGVLEIAGAVVAALLALGPGLAGARRWVRRRRRRRGPTAERAAGAWLELLDHLDIAGMPTDPTATSKEISGEAERRFGSELAGRVDFVAGVADWAICCAIDPPDPATVGLAWDTQRAVGRQVRDQLRPSRRAGALLRVGSQPRRPRDRRSRPPSASVRRSGRRRP